MLKWQKIRKKYQEFKNNFDITKWKIFIDPIL